MVGAFLALAIHGLNLAMHKKTAPTISRELEPSHRHFLTPSECPRQLRLGNGSDRHALLQTRRPETCQLLPKDYPRLRCSTPHAGELLTDQVKEKGCGG